MVRYLILLAVGFACGMWMGQMAGYKRFMSRSWRDDKKLRILRNQRDHANQHMRRMAVRLGKLNSAIDTAYKCLEAAGLQKRVSK